MLTASAVCGNAIAQTSASTRSSANREAQAQQSLKDMIVTATKTETPLEEIGYSTTVIDSEQIESSGLTYVTEILDQSPGVQFWSTGPNASNNTLSIRGMKGYHTKVLINGIPAQDPSRTQVSPTLNDIVLDNVQRIEIIRNASSTLYGSNAMSGVVNIITKKGQEEVSGRLGAEVGEYGFFKSFGQIGGTKGMMDYFLSASFIGEDGFSSKNDLSLNDDNDSFRNESYNARFGFQLSEKLRLNVFGRYSDVDEEYDSGSAAMPAFGIPATPDSGDIHIQRWMTGTELKATDMMSFWDTSLRYAFSRADSHYRDDIGPAVGDEYEGDTSEFEWRNTFAINEWNELTLGYEWIQEEADTVDGGSDVLQHRHRTNAYYAQHQMEPITDLFLTAGVRYNDHSVFGDETTASSSVSYLIDETNTKLKVSWGEGYRSPSLTELFGQWGANPNLGPEKSETWDVGFEQDVLPETVTFGMTYFDTKVEDFIDWQGGSYVQLEGIETSGVETFVDWQPLEVLDFRLSHTYLETEKVNTGDALPYRPKHKLAGHVIWTFFDGRGTLNLNVTYVGDRDKSQFDAGPQEMDEYVEANLAASYKITQNVKVKGRVRNLFNEGYEHIRDYNTYPRTFYGGLEVSF